MTRLLNYEESAKKVEKVEKSVGPSFSVSSSEVGVEKVEKSVGPSFSVSSSTSEVGITGKGLNITSSLQYSVVKV